jgi:hypothetical protein
MLSPLDQLYLETTSKEDLLAEINDQRRQVIEARGLAAEIERKLWTVEKERDALIPLVDKCEALDNSLRSCRVSLSIMKRHSAKARGKTMKSQVIEMIERGLTPVEMKNIHGIRYRTAFKYWQEYNQAASGKEKALSQSE